MSRRKSSQGQRFQVTVPMDAELAQALDQTMISFGIDHRGDCAAMMMRGWLSAVPLDTTVHEVCRISVKRTRQHEFEALAQYYADRAAMYRGT